MEDSDMMGDSKVGTNEEVEEHGVVEGEHSSEDESTDAWEVDVEVGDAEQNSALELHVDYGGDGDGVDGNEGEGSDVEEEVEVSGGHGMEGDEAVVAYEDGAANWGMNQ
jgi:hypothetical protein